MAQAISKLMKQARKMQAEMMRAQEDIARQKVEGSAGGGMVTVTLSGIGDIEAVKIKKEAVDPNDIEMLEDLIVAAIRSAQEKAKQLAAEVMGNFTNVMNFPGM